MMFSPKPCEHCTKPFIPTVGKQRFCSNLCRYAGHRATQPPRSEHKKRLRCKWCRGPHLTDRCPNRGRTPRKLYGTIGPNREYLPPPGVSVRIIQAPYALCGDQLEAYLAEREGQ